MAVADDLEETDDPLYVRTGVPVHSERLKIPPIALLVGPNDRQ
jgi:hypothetical protein